MTVVPVLGMLYELSILLKSLQVISFKIFPVIKDDNLFHVQCYIVKKILFEYSNISFVKSNFIFVECLL